MEWIKVEDRKPEANKIVLVTIILRNSNGRLDLPGPTQEAA